MATRVEYRTKVDLAVEALQQAILSGSIKPGEHLTMAQLSEELGMSSTPIREAIRLLEAEGIITNQPHRGAMVVNLAPVEANELYLIRAEVESLATRLACERLSQAELERLRELQQEMEAAVEDEEALTRANASWHLHLYSASGTSYLPKLILRLWMPFRWGRLWVPERREQSIREHRALLEALEAHDAELAGRLMHEHIEHARELVVRHLREDAASSDGDGSLHSHS